MTQSELKESRYRALQCWFAEIIPDFGTGESLVKNAILSPVSGDASFRRYFRGYSSQQSYILVDAPPDKEDSHAFVAIAEILLKQNVHVPIVHAVNYEQGFMCLSDFGDTLLWQSLDSVQQNEFEQTLPATQLYAAAFEQLLKIQSLDLTATCNEGHSFPVFDKAMLYREMELFRQWFCQDLLNLTLSQKENDIFESSFQLLIDSALSQTQVCVHRDYHSRNLLQPAEGNIGVIDFQDAVIGPFSYDLVSLLKDCYIAWPQAQVNKWALSYKEMAEQKEIITEIDNDTFLQGFDLMGVQRHLKAIGIFSRLHLRDMKSGYLADIPRTLDYVREVARQFPVLKDLSCFLEEKVTPVVDIKIKFILTQEN